MERLVLTLLVILSLGTALPIPSPDPAPAIGEALMPLGFNTLIFHENFSDVAENEPPSAQKWAVDEGTSYPGGPSKWGTDEVQSYTSTSTNLAVSAAGNLLIRPQNQQGHWTSGRVETTPDHDFACLAGQKLRIEGKIKLGDAPEGAQQGIWPAFWSLGSKYRGNYNNWPAVGEIDILETANGASKAWHTVHCGTLNGGPCEETTGIFATSPLTRGEWHTVAVEIDRTSDDWRAETISWFVDNVRTGQVSGTRVGDPDAWASLAHAKRFLLLNVAVGGAFPDAVARTTTPTAGTEGGDGAAMEVEYVAVYST